MVADDPADHYDRVTEAWGHLLGDNLHYGLFSSPDQSLAAATEALTERMAALAQPSGDLLDVGCGTGGPACLLAERFDVRVTGISTSEVGVARAEQRAGARGLGNARFEVRDAQANGFPDDSFDRVWVMESSHLMPDKAAMLREGVRVLRPGGRLVLCDVITVRKLALPEVLREARAFDLLRLVFGRAKMETLDFYRSALEEAGAEVTHVEDVSRQTRPTFVRWRENAARHGDAATALIGAEDRQRFVDSCDVLERMWDERVLGYGLISAHDG